MDHTSHVEQEQNILLEYRMQLRECQLENQNLSRHLQAMRQESEQLKVSNTSLQETLRRIQERAFRSMDRGGWTAPEDGKVRDNFLRLQEKTKQWAKNSALQIASGEVECLTFEQKEEIIVSLSGYCVPGSWDQLVRMMTPVAAKRTPYLFAQAMLSKDIFNGIFNQPFFTLEVLGESSLPTASELFSLYQSMVEINETEAHIWRSQMLRILQSPDRVSKSDFVFSGRLEKNLSRVADQHAEKFLSGPVRYLLDKPNDNGRSVKQVLTGIYTFAGQLALSLWTQRSYLKCVELQQIPRFLTGREEMSAHPIHHTEEEGTRLDGQPIVAIIQPAFLAYGNDDAEHYEQYRVWATAVVLIEERI